MGVDTIGTSYTHLCHHHHDTRSHRDDSGQSVWTVPNMDCPEECNDKQRTVPK